jgi:hypothetical protein
MGTAGMRDRFRLAKVLAAGGTFAALFAFGCGESSGGSVKPPSAAAGQNGAGTISMSGAGGTSGSGQMCTGGGCSPGPSELTAAEACRNYFTAVCERITECEAPNFRPCESPIDACPDILFAEGSAWTLEQVVACTSAWATHDCAALTLDQGPACSQVLGARPLGNACVFDSQCQTGHCNSGIVPSYDASCGTCADVSAAYGPCSLEHICPFGQYCDSDVCADVPQSNGSEQCYDMDCPEGQYCDRGECYPLLAVGQQCTWEAKCAVGLGCEVELFEDADLEPDVGLCQPLPAIGQPCLPTFSRTGLCVDGGTCTARPTGECVPLRQVGESCGFTTCVEGAYCADYICQLKGDVGASCYPGGSTQGEEGCFDGLACACTDATCAAGSCAPARQVGESCNDSTERCADGLQCELGVCTDPLAPPVPLPAASSCTRSTTFGRESSNCEEGLECLCTTSTCEQSLCALPRNLGESCDGLDEICRQGLSCNAAQCAELVDRNLEALSCTAP